MLFFLHGNYTQTTKQQIITKYSPQNKHWQYLNKSKNNYSNRPLHTNVKCLIYLNLIQQLKKRFNTKIEFVNTLQLCIVNKNKSETKTYKRKKAKRK